MKWPEFKTEFKTSEISISDFERIHGKPSNENTKIESESITIDDTPAEDLFDIYEKTRSVKDYQKLWNMGIKLHEIRGNRWAPCDYFELSPEQSFIKVYDIIDGKMTFTKIGVYEIKK